MCHHVPIDERESFAEKLREEDGELDESADLEDDPGQKPEPVPTPSDD